jgi:trehalose 6-phosphate synthase
MSAEALNKFLKKNLKNRKFVIAIQREPYTHTMTPRGIKLEKNAGGAHILLDGILKQTGGLMVAIGSGSADHQVVDKKNRYKISNTENGPYILKRIFLKKKELDNFYYGFANQTLWPLCHVVFIKPIFSTEWWNDYVNVNNKFADAILEEIGDQEAFVWINDYHLALLPKLLKERNPKLSIGTFWHIPWPTYEIHRICPWKKEILEGLLGSDLIGFHRGYHVENFVECCRRDLQVIVESEPKTINYINHSTKVANIPAGIDYTEIRDIMKSSKQIDKRIIKRDFGFDFKYLAIGVDRIDYTKGIVERLKIIDRFLEKYPEFQGKFVYLSIGAPSRVHIPAYKQLNREISDLIEKINWKYSDGDWQPIRFVNKIISRERIFTYYHLANVCLVTSLDDGMNLVAKEYAICANQKKGALLLSRFTGAAKDLSKSAYLINPYDIGGSADILKQALTATTAEKLKRMKDMRNTIRENDIYKWGVDFIRNTLE